MSTEPYTPDESALIATYWDSKARRVDNPQTSEIVAEARRGIDKIRADALRDFADEWGDGSEGFPYWPLHGRADEIEEMA